MRWAPFVLVPQGQFPEPPRSLATPEGVGDRMRAAAFAEIQARDAFLWAAEHFPDASEDLRRAWRNLAHAEQKHFDWLLTRMKELSVEIAERKVSDMLWVSLQSCKTAREFAIYMANAEERGRRAGERFYEGLKSKDPTTAEIFRKIAEEEVTHIALAQRFFPHETRV